MCPPLLAAYPALATGLQVASLGFTAIGAIQQARAQKAQGKYNKRVAENNAIIAGYQADQARDRGRIEEAQHRLKVGKLKGQQRSAIASSGFVVDEGSALDTVLDTAELGELDALTIRHNADMEAWRYRNQAADFRAQGALAQSAGKTRARDTLLTGAGSVAEKWYAFSK